MLGKSRKYTLGISPKTTLPTIDLNSGIDILI